uniref:Secreted protein n=1 Tax=Anopheles darlingi TaxID=43151 RepID=A0A2M4D459_ANODA
MRSYHNHRAAVTVATVFATTAVSTAAATATTTTTTVAATTAAIVARCCDGCCSRCRVRHYTAQSTGTCQMNVVYLAPPVNVFVRLLVLRQRKAGAQTKWKRWWRCRQMHAGRATVRTGWWNG